jgi:hypothetical protein
MFNRKVWLKGKGPWAGSRGAAHPCFKHGHGGTVDGNPSKTYSIWVAMHQRCCNSKHGMYPRYGARGIKVCSRWTEFENFLADMGEKPAGRSLDRINNDGNYDPSNCRWATKIEQARNTSAALWTTIDGEHKPVAEWCEIYGVNRSTVLHRIRRGGWSPERAITTPVTPR